VRRLVVLACTAVAAGALTAPADARVGGQAAGFASSPLVQQLQLTFGGQQAFGSPGGRVLHRYVSDDGLMYLPADARRAHQVSFFLQDALGSVVGSQRGLLSFRAAVANRSATGYRWGGLSVRFTPMAGSIIQVLVGR